MSQQDQAEKHHGLPESEHEWISEMLPKYLVIRASAQPPGPEWRELEAHLSRCKECSGELADLQRLLTNSLADPVRPPQSYPDPDLSFLETPSFDARPKELVILFTPTLLETPPQPNLAGNYRGIDNFFYEHPSSSGSDPLVTIEVSSEDKERKFHRVLVSVVDQHEPFEQEGTIVTLRFGISEHEMITDHQGCACFTKIPRDFTPHLQFIITPRPAS